MTHNATSKDKAKDTAAQRQRMRKVVEVKRLRLRREMALHNIFTWKELAFKLGIPYSALRSLVSGVKWYPSYAASIEAFLGVEPFSIFKPIPLQTSVKGREAATTAPAEKTRGES